MPDLGNTTVFSQTDANNNSGTAPSWSGSAPPSTIDDAGRGLQGAITREWNWRNFTLTAGGTADVKTLTYSVAPAAYYGGQKFGFIANTTNTGSVTLNVNLIGAKTIKSMLTGTLANLSASDMVAGMYVEVAYNTANDCFVWINESGLLASNNLSDVGNATTARSNLGLGTGDTPQFTGLELGHATDTTITRTGAGDIAIEGNSVYRAGGTDVALADGGTGSGTANGARSNLGLNTFSLNATIIGAGNTWPAEIWLMQYAPFAFTIDTIYHRVASGSGTISDVRIDNVPVTGMTSLSVSTTEASATATAANAVPLGGTVSFTQTGFLSTETPLIITILCTRTG